MDVYTKVEMAQMVVQALYNLKGIPGEDDKRVKKVARNKRDDLLDSYRLAVKVLQARTDLKRKNR